MVKAVNTIKNLKKQSFSKAIYLVAFIIVANIILQYFYFRIDLTQDKRFKLSQPTKDLLKKVDDKIYIRVYLDGELPSGFRKLRESTRQTLDEFRIVSGKKVEYVFIDPMESKSDEDQKNIMNQLIEQGLEPINLEVVSKGKKTEKIVFPGAVIFYKNMYLPVKLLQQQIGISPEQVIHNSITNIEFNFISNIKKLHTGRKQKIAFISGHGELDEKSTIDIFNTLEGFYHVERIELPKFKVGKLEQYDLAIIAKPTTTFNELEKYKIDQVIMNGGKVIWLVESLLAEIDSLGSTGFTNSLDYDLNLNDMFFKYGVELIMI